MRLPHLSYWYLVPPLATLVLIWPPISDMFPMSKPDNLNVFQIALVIPFWVGLLAAPGWLYAWAGHYDRSQLSRRARVWVGASLWVALLCCIGGLVSIFAVVPFPAVVGSLVATALLLRRYYSFPVTVSSPAPSAGG